MKKINWGTAIVIFFAIFLSLAAIFIVFAIRQNNDLVADDYYEQGAHYSETIEVKKRSLQYYDSITVSQNNSLILIEFAKTLVPNLDSLSIQFYCPSKKENDILFTNFNSIKNIDSLHLTSLTFPITDFEKTYYSIKITWKQDNLKYEIDKEIIIKK